MKWIPTISAILAVAAAFLLVIVRRAQESAAEPAASSRSAARFTLALLVLGAIGYAPMAAGTLVVSPEYGVAIAEGRLARLGLTSLLLGVALAAGYGVHVIRLQRQRTPCKWPLRALAITAALLSIPGLRSLGIEGVRLAGYDLWWPFPIVWLAGCVASSTLVLLGIRDLRWSSCLTAGLPLLVASRAVERSHDGFTYAHPWTLLGWQAVLLIGLPAYLALCAWILYTSLPGRSARPLRWAVAIAAAGVGASVAAFAALEDAVPRLGKPAHVLLFGAGLLLPIGVRNLLTARRKGSLRLVDLGRPGRGDDVAALLAVAAVLGVVIHLFFAAPLAGTLDVASFLLAWLVLLELFGGSPIQALARKPLVQTIWHAESPLLVISQKTRHWLALRFGDTRRAVSALFSADNVAGVIVKTLGLLLLLLVLSEIPNSGKLVVRRFSGPDESGALGRFVSDRLVNTLALVGQELKATVLVTSKKTDRLLTLGEDITSLQADVEASDITWGGVSINPRVLIEPVVSPLRWILGTRVVTGTLQRTVIDASPASLEAPGAPRRRPGYLLLAHASDGRTWRRELADDGPREAGRETRPNEAGPDVDVTLMRLADDLAYDIACSDLRFTQSGMTTSAEALKLTVQAMKNWEEFEAMGVDGFDSLKRAREGLQSALRLDPHFAFAYYRLGFTLREEARPAAAVQAFRAAVREYPHFAAARVALAWTLFEYDDIQFPEEASCDSVPADPAMTLQRREEAREIWRELTAGKRPGNALPHRASAYFGLCEAGTDTAPYLTESERLATYFYCRRAEKLYRDISPAERVSLPVATEARLLNNLGVLLAWSNREELQPNGPSGELPWACSDQPLAREVSSDGKVTRRAPWTSPHTQAALRHYRRALELVPEDPIVRCNAAVTSRALGDPGAMQRLERDASVLVSHAYHLQELARRQRKAEAATKLHLMSLREFERAILLEPHNVDALNGYAYTLWQWRVRWPEDRAEDASAQRQERMRLLRAEERARLAMAHASLAERAMAQDTLGVILLAQGRSEEAVEQLRAAAAAAPTHPFFDEIRWHLAQALLCEAENSQREGRNQAELEGLGRESAEILDDLREGESGLEARRFSADPYNIAPTRVLKVCVRQPENSPQPAPAHMFDRLPPLRGTMPPCNSLFIVALLALQERDAAKPSEYYLHLWGGGIDQLAPVEEPIFLTTKPKDTRAYYFTQLLVRREEQSELEPASLVEPVATSADQTGPTCSNLVMLPFLARGS